MTRVRLQYFALLRESAGRSAEERQSAARDLGELYDELQREYGFPLDRSGVRVAVDERYVPMDTPLREDMEITFIPPVAGG